jgi:hypothetical protein
MLVVSTRGTRSRLGLESLARLDGVECAQERRSLDSPEGLLGEGG